MTWKLTSRVPDEAGQTLTPPLAGAFARTDGTFSFRLLKQRVSIGQVVDAYKLDESLIRRGVCLQGPCPLHRGDNKTAFRIHLERGLWRCFTSCGGGDVVELIRRLECCDYAEAARHLSRLAQLAPSNMIRARCCPTGPGKTTIFQPFQHRIPLSPCSSFLQRRKGILPKTAETFEAGCTDSSVFLRGTVAVRLHALDGQPLGYCGRNLDQRRIARYGKWRFPPRFPKASTLFNAHRAGPFRRNGTVLVECPWAVMRLAQAGVPAVVALLGTQLSQTHLAWLPQDSPIVLMLDGDHAGRTAASTIQQRLAATGRKTAISHLPEGCEPEDLTDSQLAARARQFLPFF